MAKQKYYVVWSGKKAGIFTSWEACKRQVNGVKGARFKSYPTEHEARVAFQNGSDPGDRESEQTYSTNQSGRSDYIRESICVDAACSGNPGAMEYRAVYTDTGSEIFHFGPVPNGTNNIGEFLAIVHALALLKQNGSNLLIYTDSVTALSWVRKKRANTVLQKDQSTERIWNLIERAEKWLHHNTYTNKLLKWETKKWGEIKADFGRK